MNKSTGVATARTHVAPPSPRSTLSTQRKIRSNLITWNSVILLSRDRGGAHMPTIDPRRETASPSALRIARSRQNTALHSFSDPRRDVFLIRPTLLLDRRRSGFRWRPPGENPAALTVPAPRIPWTQSRNREGSTVGLSATHFPITREREEGGERDAEICICSRL